MHVDLFCFENLLLINRRYTYNSRMKLLQYAYLKYFLEFADNAFKNKLIILKRILQIFTEVICTPLIELFLNNCKLDMFTNKISIKLKHLLV